jgi:hydrogenase maturation protease
MGLEMAGHQMGNASARAHALVLPHALVLGIGNVLWADEGFGIRTVERFFDTYEPHESIEVVDGGTRGMALLPLVQAAGALIIFDAVDFDLEPGTLKHLSGDEVPAFLGAKKMSLHQTGFQEVLVLAELTGEMPAHVHLIGVQPELLEDYGGSLTEVVAAKINEAVALGASVLREIGYPLEARKSATDPDAIGPSALARDLYEGQRPSAEDACRIGDDRFLVLRTQT